MWSLHLMFPHGRTVPLASSAPCSVQASSLHAAHGRIRTTSLGHLPRCGALPRRPWLGPPVSRVLPLRACRRTFSACRAEASSNSDSTSQQSGESVQLPAASNPIGDLAINFAIKPMQSRSLWEKITDKRPAAESPLTYSRLIEYLNNKQIQRIDLYDNSKTAVVELTMSFDEDQDTSQMEVQRMFTELPGDGQEQLWPAIHGSEALVVVHNDIALPPYFRRAVGRIFPVIALLLLQRLVVFWLAYKAKKDPKGQRAMANKLGKSKARFLADADTGVRFSDVAGIDRVKAELREVVRTLKHDKQYEDLGVTTPKGILLYGPPGTGKTHLAKAVAAESGLPFFSANGAEFVEIFVGVAAARVRDLFERARAAEPCIIFIDEIDSIGRARGALSDAGNSEREQGLMQLLVEMDGFANDDTKVLVMAATNRPDVLDDALLRKGRFDRKLEVGLPDRAGRLEVLRVHARNKQLGDDANRSKLLAYAADNTYGFTGAELANLMNEAAILAVRYEKDAIDKGVLERAIMKVTDGLEVHRYGVDDELRRRLATVLAGKAVHASVTHGHDRVRKVSIVPHSNRPSVCEYEDIDKPVGVVTLKMMKAELASLLSGEMLRL
eukprot:jgi/Mesvir1/6214/Mv00895-RA.2